jgi:Putative DNA-binding domain
MNEQNEETPQSDFPWEDNLLERKVEGDTKDFLKTLVGFANSVKPGHIATLLIGEKDDGTIGGVANPDKTQMFVRETCDKIYPPIIWRSQVYERDGKSCIRVEVEYSGDTPHFGGIAWVRKGSETVKATDEIFQCLIALRLEKVRELAKWLDKTISLLGDVATVPNKPGYVIRHRWPEVSPVKLVHVNNHWATFEQHDGKRSSEPLEKLTLNFDDEKGQLQVIVRY